MIGEPNNLNILGSKSTKIKELNRSQNRLVLNIPEIDLSIDKLHDLGTVNLKLKYI
jgi:hypothetical protein